MSAETWMSASRALELGFIDSISDEVESVQAELKAYAFVQHCQNGFWKKADEAEFDMKFLAREFNLTTVKVVNKFVSASELKEIMKVIDIRK